MNELIWYSWLGGVIIGTMIGANSVLEEHCTSQCRHNWKVPCFHPSFKMPSAKFSRTLYAPFFNFHLLADLPCKKSIAQHIIDSI
jgi:hypothetical protein